MPRRCVLAGVLWVLAIVGGSCSDESAPSSQTTKSVLSARSIDAGSVEVTITPIRLDDQEALFTVSLDTHTVELSMNLVESAVLDVDGTTWPAVGWTGDGARGHHRSGELRFDPRGPAQGTARLTLGGFPEPIEVTWKLPGG